MKSSKLNAANCIRAAIFSSFCYESSKEAFLFLGLVEWLITF